MVKNKAYRNILLVFIALLFVIFGVSSANAQTYSFQLTDELVHYFINSDGTVNVEYYFTFKNDGGASPIDFVDVGMPNGSYDLSNASADVNGEAVSISSDYQGDGSYGFAVDLGSKAIRNTGTVHVKVNNIKDMIFPDDQKQDLVSSEFGNTYFGSNFVHGKTNLTVVFHFPVAVLPTESIYHTPASAWPGPTEPAMADTADGVTYTWFTDQANGSTMYKLGVSFPKKYIPETAINQNGWIEALIGWVASMGFFLICGGVFLFFFIIAPIMAINQAKKRKLEYIKPTISAEGQGIKRGLTAVEAAILMAVPLDKVLTMILYGATKKGAIEILRDDPLKVWRPEVAPADLYDYETEFVSAMVADLNDRKSAMQKVFVNLVKNVTEKMKGFSKKETVVYYQSIIDKAWAQVLDAKTPDITPALNEESFEWTMADREFDDRSRRVFTGPIYVPTWYGKFHPTFNQGSHTNTSPVELPSSSGKVQLPGADFAATMVSGVESFSGQLIGNINQFTGNVTNVTNPVVVPASSGNRRSGGGGGCACACACAGCACACAGGGR